MAIKRDRDLAVHHWDHLGIPNDMTIVKIMEIKPNEKTGSGSDHGQSPNGK
jgi:hypothetical protein